MKAVIGLTVMAMVAAAPAGAAEHRYLGETFDCRFPKTGHVVIDTREPGGSITVNGNRRSAQGGADFYQTNDANAPIAFLFKPDMKRWGSPDDSEPFVPCKQSKNRR